MYVIEMEELETKFSKLATDTYLSREKTILFTFKIQYFSFKASLYWKCNLAQQLTILGNKFIINYGLLKFILAVAKDLISDTYHEDEQIL